MRIAFLSSFYHKHCLQIYAKYNDLDKKSYLEQEKIIENETICSMGQWPYYFEKQGWKTLMICRNNPFIQSRWCQENDFIPKSDDHEFEIVLEQVKRFRPNIIFTFGASYYFQNNKLNTLLKNTPSVEKKFSWYGAPEGNDQLIFKQYDLVFTNSHDLCNSLISKGINTQQLNHAFEAKTLSLITKRKKNNRICFFGSIMPGNEWHNERKDYLKEISNRYTIDIYSDRYSSTVKERLKRYYIEKRYSTCIMLENLGIRNKVVQHYSNRDILPTFNDLKEEALFSKSKQPLYGIDMLQKLSEYALSFNLHIKHTGRYACNMRLFESGGVGTAMLTDKKNNLNSIFNEETDILTFNSIDEALNLIDSNLNNSQLLEEMAIRAQKCILKNHTTPNQFDKLFSLINENINKKIT